MKHVRFFSSTNRVTDKRASEVLTNKIHNEFSDVFSGIGCIEGSFTLQGKEISQQYHVPSRRVAYTLQEALKEELGRLQRQQVIVSLGVGDTSEWCNSFVLVSKSKWESKIMLRPSKY